MSHVSTVAHTSAACCLACRAIAGTSATVKNANEFFCCFQSQLAKIFIFRDEFFWTWPASNGDYLLKENGKSDLTTTERLEWQSSLLFKSPDRQN